MNMKIYYEEQKMSMKMKTVEYEDLSKESQPIKKELQKNVLPIESRKRYQTYNIAQL